MRIKISRKEAKESRYWLRLVDIDGSEDLRLVDIDGSEDLAEEREALIQEATELMNIFGAILVKAS